MKTRAILLFLISLLASGLHATKVGYAFSGGGARGLAHIGILKVLEEEGIRPDYIAGTSIGAIIGGLYAIGYSASEIESIMLSWDTSNLMSDSYKRRELYVGQKRWSPYGNISMELDSDWNPSFPTSVYTGNNLNLELARIFAPASGITDFSKLPIPFSCVATDLVSGDPVIFDSGSLMQAVRASISIPSIMKPFEIGSRLYIDGGISQNLPIDQVRQMGAETIIALKVNSDLRSRDKLNSLVAVLDQTINIGMTRNVSKQCEDSAVLLEPDLEDFTAQSFDQTARIIQAGEDFARAHIKEIRELAQSLNQSGSTASIPKLPDLAKVRIVKTEVYGNKTVSSAKVREYLKVHDGKYYNIDEINERCQFAWNSQSFRTIYPVLVPVNSGFILRIYTREKALKTLALNNTYTSEDKLSAGAVLSLNNLLLKNSTLKAELKLGGKNELNVDYVKNFGEFWGVYYRIFPYINEKTTYIYDDEHHKTQSVSSLETGFTSGIGFLSGKYLSTEVFIYGYQARLYRDISQTVPVNQFNTVSGFGLKAYHESLDDYVFPKSGFRALGKLNFARKSKISDYKYSKFYGKIDAYQSISNLLSFKLGLEYGSISDQNSAVLIDPFYVGGSDGYLGYERYEVSAPYFHTLEAGLVLNPRKNLFLNLGMQGMDLNDVNSLGVLKDLEYSAYVGIGYRSIIGPAKLTLGFPFRGKLQSYLTIGYDVDIFKFSRR